MTECWCGLMLARGICPVHGGNIYAAPSALPVPSVIHALAKAGVPTDADFATPKDGDLCIDTTHHRLYVRDGGQWKYAALT